MDGNSEDITVEVERGSGNVFADVGLPDPEVRLLKAYLASSLDTAITRNDSTQAQAAEATGLTQPEISNLLRGRVMGFSIDRLLRSLLRLGYDLNIAVIERADGASGRVVIRRDDDTTSTPPLHKEPALDVKG